MRHNNLDNEQTNGEKYLFWAITHPEYNVASYEDSLDISVLDI